MIVGGVGALGDAVEGLAGAVVVGFAVLVLARDVEKGSEEGAKGRGAGGDDADVELEAAMCEVRLVLGVWGMGG